MGDKLTNNDFLNCFNKNDFIILTETWKNKSFSLPDFEIISNLASKYHSQTHGRCSGGVAFGFKTCFKRVFKLRSFNAPKFILCKLDRKLFNIERDLFICAIYTPPRGSPYFDADVFVELETDIALFSSEGFVLIAGDLNSIEQVVVWIISMNKPAQLRTTRLHYLITLSKHRKTLII